MAGQLQTREARLPEGAGRCPTGGRESLELAFLNWALVELVERARSSLDESVSFWSCRHAPGTPVDRRSEPTCRDVLFDLKQSLRDANLGGLAGGMGLW